MAIEGGIFKNCPVVICDARDSSIIARANIIAHYASGMYIVVAEELKDVERGAHLKLLIIHDNGVSEYNGIARGFLDNAREISMFNERQREARAAARYNLNTPAVISGRLEDAARKPYLPPLDVIVENISSSGALIKTVPGHFDVGFVLEMNVDIGGNPTLFFAEVARMQINTDETHSFGCKFIYL